MTPSVNRDLSRRESSQLVADRHLSRILPCTVLQRLKREWETFSEAPPGRRFQQRYQDRKGKTGGRSRFVTIALGLLLIVAGAIMLVIPGPGILVVGFGGALIAQEFRWAAVGLDWAELLLRWLLREARTSWKSASLATRGLVVVAAVTLAAGAAYLAWTLLIRR